MNTPVKIAFTKQHMDEYADSKTSIRLSDWMARKAIQYYFTKQKDPKITLSDVTVDSKSTVVVPDGTVWGYSIVGNFSSSPWLKVEVSKFNREIDKYMVTYIKGLECHLLGWADRETVLKQTPAQCGTGDKYPLNYIVKQLQSLEIPSQATTASTDTKAENEVLFRLDESTDCNRPGSRKSLCGFPVFFLSEDGKNSTVLYSSPSGDLQVLTVPSNSLEESNSNA